MTFEELIIDSGLDDIYEIDMKVKGLYADGIIGISKYISSTEKVCVLAEELGHYYTSSGDILNQKDLSNRKQEHRARAWGYEKVASLNRIVEAYKARCSTKEDLLEYLGITEEFLTESINYYKRRYGLFYRIDDKYVVNFEPFGVLEHF
ncbi:MAG: ImmA/IrrE family metallo-endopeptidase [Firmicutes bacterium HGW-Firmicutes-2]|jgi:hypothetical protein|nr:MAG: ImmA/IrrE family metallo-endopeptidase [Firmicutes bacterium HGW-Firmicutes-2]